MGDSRSRIGLRRPRTCKPQPADAYVVSQGRHQAANPVGDRSSNSAEKIETDQLIREVIQALGRFELYLLTPDPCSVASCALAAITKTELHFGSVFIFMALRGRKLNLGSMRCESGPQRGFRQPGRFVKVRVGCLGSLHKIVHFVKSNGSRKMAGCWAFQLYKLSYRRSDQGMEPASTTKVAEEAAKALGITQLVPAIYQDLLQPAARQMGQSLVPVAKAVGIAVAPIKGAVWCYEQIEDYLKAKVTLRLATKPAEEIKSPRLVIAGPVVIGMAFAAEEPHLREMYANLLAAAMHSPSSGRVHPSFVQIIQQLAPAEAQLLQSISKKYKGGSILLAEDLGPVGELPEEPTSVRFHTFILNPGISVGWRKLCKECGLENDPLAQPFYRNLIRLGILAEQVEIVNSSLLGQLRAGRHGRKRLHSCVKLTEYGDIFLDVCVRDIGAIEPPAEPV